MNTQNDFFSAPAAEVPFRDIRSTRPTVAEEKARLALELGRLCTHCPPSVASGSVEVTRNWCAIQKQSLKLLKRNRTSVQELTAAVGQMLAFVQQP